MKLWSKIKRWFHLAFIGLFYGMKGAEDTIINAESEATSEINQKQELKGNVFQEMLNGEVTQQVQETVDASYRVFRESGKYTVQLSGMGEDGPIGDLSAVAVKKTQRVKPRNPVLETDGFKVRILQDARDYGNNEKTREEEAITGEAIDDVNTLLFRVKYHEGIMPRFHIERYIKQVVIKENEKGEILFDIYFSKYARHFMKRDSIFIAELHRLEKTGKSDVIDFENINFVSDKAFGIDDLWGITCTNKGLAGYYEFDGNLVLEFEGGLELEDLTEKHHTKELDEKYAKKAPKKESTALGAIVNRMEKEENNYETTDFKLQ